jgi:PAS domain S-box-containing protein
MPLPLNYRIQDLIDIPRLQDLLESLHAAAGIPSALIDLDGNVFTEAGWQDICTRFHRGNPRTIRDCQESDRNITRVLSLASGHAQITCPRGLIDAAIPLIIEGNHVANIFTGQFFLAPPDREQFRQQAGEFGFDEEAYLTALDRVPIISQKKLDQYLVFLSNLAESLAVQGLQKVRSFEVRQVLQESDERLGMALEAARAGTWDWDMVKNAIHWDKEFRRIFGLDASVEAGFEAWKNRVHPKDLDAAVGKIRDAIARREHLMNEHRIVLPDGGIRWIRVLGKTLFAGAMPVRMLGLCLDITANKLAEAALRERETQYCNLANSGLALIWTSGTDKLCNYFNEPWLNFTGRTLAQEIGNGWAEGVHPEDFARCLTAYVTAFDKRESFDIEYRLRHRSGEYRWIQDAGTPNYNSSGEFVGYIGHCLDITKRKQDEEALRESEERFQQLFDNMSDGVAVYRAVEEGRDFVFVDINKPGQALNQIRLDGAVGRRVTEVFPSVERIGLLDVLRRVWQTGLPEHHPLTLYKDEHLAQWVENYIYKLPSGLVVAIYSDSSEKIRAGEENARLQSQLNHAQKMEAIGVLAGGIAHDFNNILGPIIGYAEMAREDAAPGSQLVQDLDQVLTSAHRAKDLVRQILAFSRQATAERMAIKIQPLLKESLKMLRASIPATITIRESIDPRCGAVLADPTQVHQILMNLCTNAFHAMEKSGGVLSIGLNSTFIHDSTPLTAKELPPGEYVELMVSDNGTGIGPDIIDKIFDPYFTTKEIGKGTGLGLSITHGIIKSYGGAITVESTLGQGTTFYVYFPVIQEEARKDEEIQEVPGGKERILLVDDEELLARMGKNMLERLGYTVTTRHSGIDALETFMNDDPDQFDLVITDQTMSGMTGFDLARRMLQIRPELPIILCTGFSYLVNEESAKAIGIREFALKPLTKASIGQLIRKVLDRGSEPNEYMHNYQIRQMKCADG